MLLCNDTDDGSVNPGCVCH